MELYVEKYMNRFIVIAVVGILLIVIQPKLIIHLLAKQIEYYTDNITELTKLWMSEGMPSCAVTISISDVVEISEKLQNEMVQAVIGFSIAIATAAITRKMYWGSINISQHIEIFGVVFLSSAVAIGAMTLLCQLDIWIQCVVVALGVLFFFITRKIISKKRLFLFNAGILLLIEVAFDYFLASKATGVLLSTDFPIEKAPSSIIGDKLKERIIKVCECAGITRENVFIRPDRNVNAFATSGLRFKHIVILAGILTALDDDQLISVVHHEIGHIKHNHVLKSASCILVWRSILLVVFFSTYTYVDNHCNGLAGFSLGVVLYGVGLTAQNYFLDGEYSRYKEREADYASYTIPGTADSFCDAMKNLAISSNGVNFNFNERWLVWKQSHPPTYSRITAARNYASTQTGARLGDRIDGDWSIYYTF